MNVKKYGGKFYCFSPPVMLFTFLFEFGAAFYILWKYKLNTLTRLCTMTLLALGTFQLSEYMICGGLGLHGVEWAKLGFISITLLPALGIHLVATLAGKKATPLIVTAYASMIAFAAFFALSPDSINAHECRANYAVFNLHIVSSILFGLYYYGWMIAGATLAWVWSRRDAAKRSALQWMVGGYALFMIPTTAANIVDPSTIAGVPSIMCGFAVFLAMVIVGFVLPKAGAARSKSKTHESKSAA